MMQGQQLATHLGVVLRTHLLVLWINRDLGAHIDGWIATGATSLVVQSDPAAPVTGRAADLLAATHTAMEAALRLVRPGHRISAVPEILGKVSLWRSLSCCSLASGPYTCAQVASMTSPSKSASPASMRTTPIQLAFLER